ncbi:DUF2997 domain-containing protein [Brevibacillus choshinensis]|uniref:DUF2997 domain-containing protein n=1 Tax=Brevibacillus choshinensis TaxID=54911 RepID=UPI002E21A480|nr:DUF2997 domain-containing protein [Brevibacillus choshinensis]
MKKIIITVGLDGEVSIEANNYKGSECDEATRPFEAALGDVVKKRRQPEYYASQQENVMGREKSYE